MPPPGHGAGVWGFALGADFLHLPLHPTPSDTRGRVAQGGQTLPGSVGKQDTYKPCFKGKTCTKAYLSQDLVTAMVLVLRDHRSSSA